MKITLINPPFLFPVEQEITLSHCLGLRYISSYLNKNGSHQVVFIDALNLGFENIKKYANGYIVGLEIEEIIKQIPQDTDLIGISVPFSQLAPIAHDLIDLAKSRFPHTLIVMGGVYPSTQPHLALLSKADLIVVGEGERALLQIASGKDPQGIKGVYSRADTQDEIFSATDLIEDLDTLPFPDDTLPNMDQYYNISPRNDRTHRTASIITSRGCPFHCEFCSIHPVYGHRWRGRSAENVLSEMEYLNKKHGINCFEIEDDNFMHEKQRTVDILEGIVRLNEKGCNLMWRSPNGVRIDTIDADIAQLIKRSNCKEIVVALEHGDREMLHFMNKKLDLDKAYDVIKMLVEQRIPHITIFVIVGYPGENRDRFLKGLAYLKRIKALGGSVSVWVNIAQPYPGTRLLQRCKEAGYLSDPSIDNFLVKNNLMSTEHFVPITTPDFDAQEVLHRKRMIQEVFSPSKGVRSGGEAENLRSYTNPEAEHPVATRTPRKDDSVRILLCGWYFQGNTGDDLSIEPILKTLSKYGEVRVSTTEIFDRDLIGWCDLLVIGSGSHITPRGISSYKQVKYAKESGKKVVFYSQTIEEGHPQFREHLARADLITVRDAESKRVVEANGFRAVLASDPIFKTKRRAIGCSFRRWVNEPPGIVDRFASILDDLALDYDVVLLPFTEVDTDTESDTAFHEQIMYKMKKKPRQAAYEDEIENVDLLIGMRLHALISALNIGKQVLAIDYDTKIRRIFSDLALEDRVVSYDTVDQIPQVVRGKIFRSDGLAMREKVNEALIARICEEIKGEAKPKISVVMPTYNRENYLKEAIDSIEEQTLQDWELIVIDDGSTDDTRGLVESYKDERILYHNFGHNGITFSRNIGSLLSRGEIIAVADSDDVNLPNRLEVTYKEMERHGADILYSSMFHFRGTGEKELIPSHPFSDERLKKGNFIYHPTVAYRRKVAMTCPYSEALQMVEDYHLYLQAAEKGYKFHQVEEPLVMHRLHETQISAARSEEMAEIHRRLVHSRGKAVRTKVDQHHPMVSVIVTTYNRPEMLKEALMSILSQTYQNFEIIVVNDAGEDVKDVIDSLNSGGKIIYLKHEENKGLPAARNTGLRAARGRYVAYLDDDDIYYSNHLETLVGFLEETHYKAAYTDSYHAFEEWITDRYIIVAKKIIYSQDFDPKKLLISNYFPIINVIHRKDILEYVGLFDETLNAHEDWDLWIRISQQCDFHHIKTVTAEVRVRSDGTTMTSRDRMPFLKTLKTIHARYSHQVTDSRILEEQKKVEESLTREVEILQLSSSVMQYEHLHRYRFAKEYVKGRKVLDLASGEGDGDFMLSEDANEVIGMDTDELVIRRASSNNARENLKFIKGSTTDVPIKGEKIFDVIVCFRPPQGIEEWDKLMKEVKRLIIGDGIFVASVPNQYFSLDQSNYQPPTHLRGLSIDEFRGLLNRYFENTILYGQKVYPSSNIFPLFGGIHKTSNYVIEKTEAAFLFTQSERKRALHFISVSSNGPVKDVIGHSYLVDVSETLFKLKDAQIKGLELDLRERDSHIMSLEAAIKDKGAHVENLERQREENYRDWQAHEKNLRTIIDEKQTHIGDLDAAIKDKDNHIGNLERQREENYRDWQAHEKNLRTVIEDKDTHIGNLQAIMRDKDSQLRNLEVAVKAKDAHISNLEPRISEKDAHITNLESEVKDKEAHVVNLEAEVRSKDDRIRNLENSIKDKEAALNRIYNSYGLGALLVCNKLVDKLFPFNSKRRLFAKIILSAVKNPKAILKNLNKNNIKLFFHYVKNVEPTLIGERAETIIFKQAIFMYCDKAVLDPAMVEVAGWAISTEGIEKIEVYCDEALLGNASYGLPRPDVHAFYPFIIRSDRSGFSLSLPFEKSLSTGKHELLVKAIACDGKIEEIRQFIDVADSYLKYLKRTTPNEGTLRWMREVSENFILKPFISLSIILKEETSHHLARSLDSVAGQAYPFWNILLFYEKEPPEEIMTLIQPLSDQKRLHLYPLSQLNDRLSLADCDFLGFINSGDVLYPHTFFEMAKRINSEKAIDLIYTDEDILINGERKEPYFKPDWSPDLFLGVNYIGRFFLLRKELFTQLGGLHYDFSLEGVYDLLLRITEHTPHMSHIPMVLYSQGESLKDSPSVSKQVLEEALKRRGIKGEVIPLTRPDTYRIKFEILGPPKVSIIIPTAYKKPELFKACLTSIIEKSSYKNYEILIVNNSRGKLTPKEIGSLIPQTISYDLINFEEPFNFSKLNNFAASKAKGDYLIFLNDDTEVITPEWIEALLGYAQQPEVGVVGAKLLYPDETIQHAGMFLVDHGGGARHAFRFFPKNADGYMGLLKVARNCSAVTFACVMVSKEVFLKLGGLDENLKIENNDLDFCLRALAAGYRTVWTPFAQLFHRELTTRETICYKDDTTYFWNRWRPLLEKGDPYYNPNLNLDSDDFSLNMKPVLVEHYEPYLSGECEFNYHRRESVPSETIERILVVKLDHIGDMILAIPAIKMLKTKFPKAKISILIGSWTKPIVEKILEIDEILTFDFFFKESEKGERVLSPQEIDQLQKMLHSRNFDLAIDLRRHPETRGVLMLSGARYTVGYSTGKEHDNALTVCLKVSKEMQDIPSQIPKPHISTELCRLVQAIPTDTSPVPPSMQELKVSFQVERNPNSPFPEADFLVGIHPGVGNPLKQWPIAYFSRLSDLLVDRYRAQVVLFGGEKERESVSQLVDMMDHKHKAISLAGKTSLEEFMNMVKYCQVFIGNDSGPCHIAGVTGVPTLIISGGQVSPYEWHPLGDKTISVRLDVPCAPCYKALPEHCPHNVKCLNFLWPEKVLEAIEQLLAVSGSERVR